MNKEKLNKDLERQMTKSISDKISDTLYDVTYLRPPGEGIQNMMYIGAGCDLSCINHSLHYPGDNITMVDLFSGYLDFIKVKIHEFNSVRGKINIKRFEFVESDIFDYVPNSPKLFHKISCHDVLHFFDTDKVSNFMKKAYDLLNDGGELDLSFYTKDDDHKEFHPYDFVNCNSFIAQYVNSTLFDVKIGCDIAIHDSKIKKIKLTLIKKSIDTITMIKLKNKIIDLDSLLENIVVASKTTEPDNNNNPSPCVTFYYGDGVATVNLFCIDPEDQNLLFDEIVKRTKSSSLAVEQNKTDDK